MYTYSVIGCSSPSVTPLVGKGEDGMEMDSISCLASSASEKELPECFFPLLPLENAFVKELRNCKQKYSRLHHSIQTK